VRKLLAGTSGTAVVEFAIALPFLVLLLIGTIELGRYMYFAIVTQHASEAGAQYGAQSLANAANSANIEAAVAADAPNVSVSASPAAYCLQSGQSVSCPVGTPSPGVTEYVQVKVSGTFKSLLNYPGIPNSVPITATTTMRVLAQ
jgi:Flp pilus assembly protein TadG